MSSRQTIVGLDFGAYSIKAVWVERRGGRVALLRTEELQLPPETQDPVRFITPWLEKHGIPKNPCALALPGSQIVFQPVTLAAGDPRTPQQAAEMEVAVFNDMAGEAMTHSAAVFDGEAGARHLLMAMVRPEIVDKALRGAAAFSLQACELAPSPVALFNAASRSQPARPAPTLYLQIGHASTDVAIGLQGGLLFARSFAMGGKAFTEALLKARGGALVQVERLKRTEAGLDPENPLAADLQPAATLWLSQLKSTLAVYRGQFPEERFAPGNIVLCGGGGALRGLAEFTGERLQRPCAPLADPDLPPAFTTAFGLALAALHKAACPLSLLPRTLRDEIVFREKKPYWVAAGVCASLALAVFFVSGIRGIGRERAIVEAESRRIAELRRIDSTIRKIRTDIEATRDLGRPALELLQAGPLVRELVTLVANSIHPDDWITMLCDEAVYLPPPPPETAAKPGAAAARGVRDLRRPAPAATGVLRPGTRKPAPGGAPAAAEKPPGFTAFIIEGYTPHSDLETVKDLVRRLLTSELVARADVLGDERVLPAALLGDTPPDALTRDLTHFVVRVEVRRP